ncbi:MAG: divalent-cation tolerance protein CutA [Candidatus Zixiibacteriota bacterium]
MNDVCVAYISIPRDEADKMARALVEQRMAACVNVTPKIHSFFWWDDAVQEDEESLLIIKTTRQKFAALRDYVIENHPYELPEIIAMPLVEGSSEYIEWVKREVSRG